MVLGSTLLRQYKDSLVMLFSSLYPEHSWLPWKFKHAARNYWKSKENIIRFMEHMRSVKGFTTIEDWYKLSVDDFSEQGGNCANFYRKFTHYNCTKLNT